MGTPGQLCAERERRDRHKEKRRRRMAGEKHTILLTQTGNLASRTYRDFETVRMALDGICIMFEKKLKELNPNIKNIEYQVDDLYRFIDSFSEIVALINHAGNSYEAFDSEWIKKRIYGHLRRQAA